MTWTNKDDQWYFGMKAHIGVDDRSGLVHTVVGTPDKASDMSQFGDSCTATRNAPAPTGTTTIRRFMRSLKRT